MAIKIRQQCKSEILISVPFSADTANIVKSDIETIVSNLSPEQLHKLAKVSKNPAMKNIALGALNKFVS